MPTIINNFSGGLCSFWAAHRNIQKYGRENNVLLFADTLVESPDLYAFLDKSAELLGVPVTRVSVGLTPWQLFRKERMIANNRFPICSVRLKREPLDAWRESRFSTGPNSEQKPPGILSVGFDWTESHRTESLRKENPTWTIIAPMQDEPIWDKCRMQHEAEAIGLPLSSAYRLGLPHDNCGGGCVRAGISHWAHLLSVRPEVFAEWEREERETAEYLTSVGVTPFSMLKDRRGGTSKNLYLSDLRKRVEAGEQLDKHDWGGCGCGGAKE